MLEMKLRDPEYSSTLKFAAASSPLKFSRLHLGEAPLHTGKGRIPSPSSHSAVAGGAFTHERTCRPATATAALGSGWPVCRCFGSGHGSEAGHQRRQFADCGGTIRLVQALSKRYRSARGANAAYALHRR